MAGSHITRLRTLPWPALAGASVLLHAGALILGLPHIMPVGEPADSSVNIPVTLVDVDTVPPSADPVKLPQAVPPSPISASPQSTLSPSTAPQASPSPSTAAQPVPSGGQNTTVPPMEPISTQPAPSDPPADTAQVHTDAPKPERASSEDLAEHQPTPDNKPSDADNAGAESSDDTAEPSPPISNGPTEVRILDDIHLAKGAGGDQIDTYPKPLFSIPVTLPIPSGHGCQGNLSTHIINVGVAIDANGLASSLRLLQPTIYEQNTDLKLADCLLSHALQAEPIRFTPATRLTNIGEEEAVLTDRVQLRLQFSGG